MADKAHFKLTELELEVMKIIWELSNPTVPDVHEKLQLSSKKSYAYTTVATMMKILEKKKFLRVKKAGRAHAYQPRVSKHEFESSAIDHLLGSVLDDSPSGLVMRLLDKSNIDENELKDLRKIIEERLKP